MFSLLTASYLEVPVSKMETDTTESTTLKNGRGQTDKNNVDAVRAFAEALCMD